MRSTKYQRYVAPEHEAEFRATCTSRHVLKEQFRRLGSITELFAAGLIELHGGSAGYHMGQILKLADRVGVARVAEALRRAAHYGAFDHNAVARIVAGKPAKSSASPRARVAARAPRAAQITQYLKGTGVHQRSPDGYTLVSKRTPSPPAHRRPPEGEGGRRRWPVKSEIGFFKISAASVCATLRATSTSTSSRPARSSSVTSRFSRASSKPKSSRVSRPRSDRRLRYAEFPEVCRIEDYDFKQQPCLDRKAVLNLAELGFVDRCESVLWIGPSGVGKTHLSIALGVRACEANYSVRFVRAYPLLRRLYASLADDTLEEALDELAKPDVLIIDELGNSPKKHEDDFAGVFFELVARRYRRGAIILTTNLGFDQWSSVLGSPSQVTPAIDRLIEGAHIITFPQDAESYRAKRKGGPGPLPSKKKGGFAKGRRTPPDAPPSPPP